MEVEVEEVIEKVVREFKIKGLFSEYLPSNFNLKSETLDIFKDIEVPNSIDYIEPYKFTMSRFKDNESRRVIHLPEITAYISAVNYMDSEGIIKELIEFSAESENSFSKIIQSNGEILKHETSYGHFEDEGVDESRFIQSTYIPNVAEKIKRAQGAKGILFLDISNFYGCVYTHIFPAILLGYDKAMEQYKHFVGKKADGRISDIYIRYEKLDGKVRRLNSNRTNGLLTGPLLSFFLAEALLTRIDQEIESAGVSFVRYVDDFEIIIYEEDDIDLYKTIISDILGKYHFSINNEKTKYVKFPYYVVENLQTFYEEYVSSKADSKDLIKIFNKYFSLENEGNKGAIRYLVKSINEKFQVKDYSLYVSYLLNVLVNDNRSLIKVCELIIKDKDKLALGENHIKIIKKLILQYVRDKKDLEVIWLIYLLKNLGVDSIEEIIVKNVIRGKNELAIIMIIEEYTEDLDDSIIAELTALSSSWILLYQLFLKNHISTDEFEKRVGLNKSKHFYRKLKYERFTFYKPISDDSLIELPF
ncbi:reverse transcriptase domain-containing protein [Bacillus amyloliquefaciens]|uniref:reverse transcriptase domain-containing protein n=1 Tax=Bacillus amyloliquefaciens TaxID=1390 RepID=UPI00336B0ED1